MCTHGPEPSWQVLAEFGLSGPVTPLPGGQGRSWRAGPAVLKPADMSPTAVAWQSQVLRAIDGHAAFRVSPPLPARDGRWVVSGWTAWRWEPGRRLPRHWQQIVQAGHQLHAALAAVPVPPWLAERADNWSIGDRVAWGELPARHYAGVKHLAELVAALRPVSGVPQLVHGDLTGNVLFAADRPPLIIDLSPYRRPPQFAAAIVVADALVFESAGPDIVDVLGDDPERGQYLLRALIYRAVTDHLARPELRRTDADDPYLPAVTLVLRLMQRP
ncbi:hypothetical protein [Jatrophihabitans sp.]|jgi:uncharacterized protein (TIGR02569 family)|uniref:hypothetical protein n=1 Tax=Jatrophihabitans sp. TaxID=1932789 RepID=UPI002F0CD261